MNILCSVFSFVKANKGDCLIRAILLLLLLLFVLYFWSSLTAIILALAVSFLIADLIEDFWKWYDIYKDYPKGGEK